MKILNCGGSFCPVWRSSIPFGSLSTALLNSGSFQHFSMSAVSNWRLFALCGPIFSVLPSCPRRVLLLHPGCPVFVSVVLVNDFPKPIPGIECAIQKRCQAAIRENGIHRNLQQPGFKIAGGPLQVT